jgi:hypothetical protein
MIIVLERGAKPEQVEEVIELLRREGVEVKCVRAAGKPVLHVQDGATRRAHKALTHDAVEGLLATSGPRIRREGHRFYPYHALHWFAIWMVVVATLVLLAGQLPPGIGRAIDLQTAPEQVVVPWYGRAATGFLALFPHSASWLAWTLMWVALALFVALPRFDRRRNVARAPLLVAVAALVAVVAWLATGGNA